MLSIMLAGGIVIYVVAILVAARRL